MANIGCLLNLVRENFALEEKKKTEQEKKIEKQSLNINWQIFCLRDKTAALKNEMLEYFKIKDLVSVCLVFILNHKFIIAILYISFFNVTLNFFTHLKLSVI